MESASSSDVDVMEDDNFEDAKTFFDTDFSNDKNENEAHDKHEGKFYDLAAISLYPLLSEPDDSDVDKNDVEVKCGSGSQEMPRLATLPFVDESFVRDNFVLINNDTNEGDVQQSKQEQKYTNEDNFPTYEQTELQESRLSNEKAIGSGAIVAEVEYNDEEDAIVDESIDVDVFTAVKDEKANQTGQTSSVQDISSENIVMLSNFSILPPPAPSNLSIVFGSMNPVENDSDNSDDSDGDNDDTIAMFIPPLQLDSLHDDTDDDDVLEVDAAVVNSIQIEQQFSATENNEYSAKAEYFTQGKNETEEVRAAHATTEERDSSKITWGLKTSTFIEDDTMYQSMRKEVEESRVEKGKDTYPFLNDQALPDEREFENEIEMTAYLTSSIATTNAVKEGECLDDDEFAFDLLKPGIDSCLLSEDQFKARKDGLETQKKLEEEELLKDLKHATEQEKQLIERSLEASACEAVGDADNLSLTELHNIYKRGLGDQEALREDESDKDPKPEATGSYSTSVMGRIFSQTQGMNDTIKEEADEEGSETEETPRETGNTTVEPAEWREIKLVQQWQSGEDTTTVQANASIETTTSVLYVSYTDAARYLSESSNVMQHKDSIVAEDFTRGSCLNCLSRPRLTFPGAIDERDRVFCIAATAFDAHNEVIFGILQTIYKKMMKESRDVFLIGKHWEDIGFQGTDPSTDLRGCGVLSLLQMLYLIETFPDLAQAFHALSHHPTRHFPFACMLINITLQCLMSLRSGALYPECNKCKNVLSAMNKLFIALVSQLYTVMQSRSETDISIIMKDVFARGRVHPKIVIVEAFDGDTLRSLRTAPAVSNLRALGSKEDENDVKFSEIWLNEE